MNIWLINHYAVPPALYPLARTSCFAKYLEKLGHTVTIFAASTVHNSDINLIEGKKAYREETVDGVRYVYVRTCRYRGNGIKRIINMFQFSVRVRKVCGHFAKPDAILASSATPPACMAGLKLSQKYGCRGVAEVSDLWPESFVAYGLIGKRNPLLIPMYMFEKRMYKKADAVIFTMEGGADYIRGKGWDKEQGGPVDMAKVFHINNGVDMEEFEYNREHYRYEDPDLTAEGVFKAVYAGTVGKANSLAAIVGAAEILQEKGADNIRFIIYGDGEERKALVKSCSEKGLSNIVFKGRVDKKYIPFILSSADLNIVHVKSSPIMRYGMSLNKLFDYFAAGRPILSDMDTNYDLIKKYSAGVVITSQEPREIAEAVLRLSMESIEYLSEFSKNARRAAEDFDFKKLTEKLSRILLEEK